MTKTDDVVRLTLKLPEHVLTILDGWAASDVQATPEEILEALADALCTNEELRTFCAELLNAKEPEEILQQS